MKERSICFRVSESIYNDLQYIADEDYSSMSEKLRSMIIREAFAYRNGYMISFDPDPNRRKEVDMGG